MDDPKYKTFKNSWIATKNIWNKCYLNDTTGQNCVLLNSVQEFIETEAWMLLTFFLCLQNQLLSIHSTVTYWREKMFEKYDSSDRQKWMVPSFSISARFTAKLELFFVLTQENAFSWMFHFKAACRVQIWKKKYFVKTVTSMVTVLFKMRLYMCIYFVFTKKTLF